jgi:hypothetical protein
LGIGRFGADDGPSVVGGGGDLFDHTGWAQPVKGPHLLQAAGTTFAPQAVR